MDALAPGSARAAPDGRSAADHLLFLRAWARAPLAIAAQAPSGEGLARAMAAAVNPSRPGAVLELDPGSDSFTAARLARGAALERPILVEREPAFTALLRARYPRARIARATRGAMPAS